MRYNFLAIGLLLASSVLSRAQESLPIGPGDMLHVIVFDTPELEQHTRVNDNGNINLIEGGYVKVAGLTANEAARAIELTLVQRGIMKHPHVEVNLDEFATQKVSVLGDVHAPGAYPITTARSILEVLSLAGGLLDTANRNIVIQRHSTGEKISYFVSNRPAAAFDSAVKIYPGDIILVPKSDMVYALGDFNIPGAYLISDNDSKLTVLELVARAGGAPPTAVTSHALLIHRTATGPVAERIQLTAMMKGRAPDIAIQPGDIVYVPFSFILNAAKDLGGIVSNTTTASIYSYH